MAVILRYALRLRYWFVGGAVGGGLLLENKYEEWKNKLPSLKIPYWLKERNIDGVSKMFNDLKQSSSNGFYKFRDGLKGIEFYNTNNSNFTGEGVPTSSDTDTSSGSSRDSSNSPFLSYFSRNKSKVDEKPFSQMDEAERIQKLQDELLKTQLQYQKEMEHLEKENKNLKQRLLLKDSNEQRRTKKIKRSLIEMYSEMLDMLIHYDSSYGTTDNLPRVVVVGDQSSGKTSVLEMIAQARIFPRGSGEMMTRAPVKVTLGEGPYHIAQFRDSEREFDLTKEEHLAQLRNEIEMRMRNSVRDGKTVSKDEIALTIKGPSLPRMVLVDLPGVISTVTTEMASETKEDIMKICRLYMENPNAIILCIQDGSVDAERSNVTDLVSCMDPSGQRTILVLTKVDLAERNLSNPGRIKKILEGKLFPMKALGYFGVVTGKGTESSSIEEIRHYEEEFFTKSRLFREGILKATQMTTKNMSLAVSDCFWRMVRESIEAQADAFRAIRFNLETEWRNNFMRKRELSRDELFDKARGEVLDEIVNLSQVRAEEWESTLKNALWSCLMVHAFDQILIPSCNVDNPGSFNTMIDIKLKHWADKELANKSVQVGWETLSNVFRKQVEEGINSSSQSTSKSHHHRPQSEHAEILKPLKNALVETALSEHHWDSKALDYLRAIQFNAIADSLVPDQRSWNDACDFMARSISERRNETIRTLADTSGRTGWSFWRGNSSSSPEKELNSVIHEELTRFLAHNPDHKQPLLDDDLAIIRNQLESRKEQLGSDVELTNERIRQQWRLIYRRHFLDRMLRASSECKYYYQNYRQGIAGEGSTTAVTNGGGSHFAGPAQSDLECQAVVFFHRINQMLSLTSNALRQQIINTEQRRLEKEVKDILDDWSQDLQKKRAYLTGRQVELAEEMAQVRHIQERLEEFIVQLHQEKSF